MDYRGIDEFGLDGSTYILVGNFGHLDIEAGSCDIMLD
jgi:hypothetical protein